MISNIVIDIDAYKIKYHLQRPSILTYFYSYGESIEGELKDTLITFLIFNYYVN